MAIDYEALGCGLEEYGIEYGIERDEDGNARYVVMDNGGSCEYVDSLADAKTVAAGCLRFWIDEEQERYDYRADGSKKHEVMMALLKMRDALADMTDEDDDEDTTPAAEMAEHAKARARNMLKDLRNACQYYGGAASRAYTFDDFEEVYTWSACYEAARERIEACRQDDETKTLARDLTACYEKLESLYEEQTGHDMP